MHRRASNHRRTTSWGVNIVQCTTVSGHSHQGQAHSEFSECDRRPTVSAKSTNNYRMQSLSQDRNKDLREVGRSSDSLHICHSPQHSVPTVHVSDSGSASTGSGCSVTTLAGTVDLHVSSICLAEQGHSETTSHPGR